ncbi:hypothetical protein [Brevibacillus fulvus]|uniref:Uncharacterized protein n=1 Tax=Brevibacillus fulvus TaxID=1125967 RepID=A0A938XWZ3_9BACL|nr:hypothetical protein [Brevibacillus fulvus]MBM7591727.1 hypothetical protein [Brevibacillus fulvus]
MLSRYINLHRGTYPDQRYVSRLRQQLQLLAEKYALPASPVDATPLQPTANDEENSPSPAIGEQLSFSF